MAILINTNVPNILNGVSQQANDLRRPSQGTEQINAISSIIDGLKKRPPFNNITKLHDTGTVLADNSFFSVIDRDDSEKHLVDIQTTLSLASLNVTSLVSLAADITLKNEDGDPLTSTDLTYLCTDDPTTNLRSLVVDDYTFFINKAVQAKMTSDTSDDPGHAALLFCKAVRDSATYTIELWKDNTSTSSADYTATYSASSTADQGVVAAGLVTALDTAGANTDFTYSSSSGVIHVKQTDATDFGVEVESTYTGSFYAFKDSVQSLSLLPESGYAGFTIQVENSADDTDDEYYVQYFASNTNIAEGFATGYWQETVASGIEYKLDRDTMPHVLVSDGSNTFTFKPLDWDEKIAGDVDSNPNPSFIDEYVRGIFFYQNRLALLTGEGVVFSEIGNYFNFTRTTVLQQLDTDPIDIALTSESIALLNWGLVNSEQVVIFSNNAQFSITHATTGLTPSSVESKQVTKYSCFEDCKPVALGNSIFFGYDKGEYSGVREYFIGTDSTLFNAIDASDQCPRYIKGNIDKLVGIDAENLVIAKQKEDPNILYCYKFYNKGDTRVLSSWFKLDLGYEDDATINDIFSIGNKLYCVITRNDGTYIEYADMSSGLKDDLSDSVVSIDRRITEDELSSISYSAITNLTTFTLPYAMYSEATPAIVTRVTEDSDDVSNLNNVTLASSTTLTVRGDYSDCALWLGQLYTMEYIMTRPAIRQSSDSGGSTALYNGRMQVRYLNISLDNTQYLQVIVSPDYKDSYTYTYTPRILGTGATVIGQSLPLTDDVFRVPIYAQNRQFELTLTNDTPFQSNILGVNWEASVQLRSRTQ